jgi:hypothetical protein
MDFENFFSKRRVTRNLLKLLNKKLNLAFGKDLN